MLLRENTEHIMKESILLRRILKFNLKENTSKIPSVIYVLFIGGLGFVTGVLTIGLKQGNWLVSGNVLEQDFICRINELCIDKRALFFLCLGKRLRAFFILFLLAFSSVNVFSNVLFFFLHGLYIGSLVELFAVRYGWQGIVMYLSLVAPQGIFYVPGFVILGCWCWNLEKITTAVMGRKKEKVKKVSGILRVAVAFILILLGCIVECCISIDLYSLFF